MSKTTIVCPPNYMGYFMVALLATLLALRPMYAALDDYNYINYFSYSFQYSEFSVRFFMDEPLWLLYSVNLGKVLGSENALRMTLFLSVWLFFAAFSNIKNKNFISLIIFFVICQEMAVQLYFNQIRQGLALSLFLFVAVRFRMPIFAALLAATIHTSFLVVIAAQILVVLIKKRSWLYLAIFTVSVGVSIYIFSHLSIDDLGRRAYQYENAGKLNVFYYTYLAIQYFPVIFWMSRLRKQVLMDEHYLQAIVYMMLAITISLFSEAGGRLMYIVPVFWMWLILENFQSKHAKLALTWLLCTLLFSSLYGTTKVESYDSWLGRWYLIFGI